MKKILGIALTAGLAATMGVAQAARPTFYVEVDVVGVTTKVVDKTSPPDTSGTAKVTTLRLKGGAHFLDWLDAELHLVLPKNETFSRVGGTNNVQTAVFGVFAKPNVTIGRVNIYGLAGIASGGFTFEGSFVGTEGAASFAYGAGIKVAFTRNVSGVIEYTQYVRGNIPVSNQSGGLDVDVKAVGIGVNYAFR